MTKGMTTGRKSVWGYALIFVVCFASFSWAEESDQSAGLLEQGNRLIEEKKFEEAIGCFDRILEADPENVEALLARTDANINLKRWDAAIKDCSRILRIDRQNVKALLARANANTNLKRWNFVIQDCDRILKIEPENVEALLTRTEANVNLKKWEAIIRDCNHVLKIDLLNGPAYRRRGLARLALNDPELLNEVFDDLRKAVEVEPQEIKNISNALSVAMRSFRQILSSNNEDLAFIEKILTLHRNGELALLRFGIDDPKNQEKNREEILLLRAGFIVFSQEIEAKTNQKLVHDKDLLELYASIDENFASPEAVPFFRELSKPENAENLRILFLSAAIADLKSQFEEGASLSLENYTPLTEEEEAKKRDRIEFLYVASALRAESFGLRAEYEKAIDDYSLVLKIDPKSTHALYSKGYSLASLERYQEAISCLSESLEIEENPETLLLRGKCYAKSNDFDNAEIDSEKLLRLDPLEPEYHELYGGVKLNRQDYQGAIQAYSDYIHLLEKNHIASAGSGKLIRALSLRSVAYQKLNMFRELEKDQQKIQLLQDQTKKTFEAAVMLFEEDRFEELLPLLEPFIQDYPQHSESRYIRARAFFHLGRYDEAMGDTDFLITLDPRDGRFWELKILNYKKREKYEEALHCGKKALENVQENNLDSVLYALWWPSAVVGDLEFAEECLKKTDQMHPEDSTIPMLCFLATLSQHRKDYQDALEYRSRMISRIETQSCEGEISTVSSDENALLSLRKEITWKLLKLRARIYEKLDKAEEAKKDLDRATELEKEIPPSVLASNFDSENPGKVTLWWFKDDQDSPEAKKLIEKLREMEVE